MISLSQLHCELAPLPSWLIKRVLLERRLVITGLGGSCCLAVGGGGQVAVRGATLVEKHFEDEETGGTRTFIGWALSEDEAEKSTRDRDNYGSIRNLLKTAALPIVVEVSDVDYLPLLETFYHPYDTSDLPGLVREIIADFTFSEKLQGALKTAVISNKFKRVVKFQPRSHTQLALKRLMSHRSCCTLNGTLESLLLAAVEEAQCKGWKKVRLPIIAQEQVRCVLAKCVPRHSIMSKDWGDYLTIPVQ